MTHFTRVWLVLGTMALAAVLFVGVFPTRTWFAQRAATNAAQERLEVLREQNDALGDRAEALQNEDEIERLAREQYGLVRPDEEAYAILPAPGSEDRLPDPVEEESDDDRNLLERAWDGITGIF